MSTSPVLFGPSGSLSAPMMRMSTTGMGGSTEPGLALVSAPLITVTAELDSVSPSALLVLRTLGKVSANWLPESLL
jgi:hypothetical protein